MSKKLLTIQDISCYGSCSITVALPILSSMGIETAILPSAILSTHTCGFKDFTVLDLTDEMPKIINHWINEGIKFDCIYTGYIGDVRQFDYILKCKDYLLNDGGLFIVDPAMADHGKLYPALNSDIVMGMKKICSAADYILPNITEACFLTDTPYEENQNDEFVDLLLDKLYKLYPNKIILTGVLKEKNIGAAYFDGTNKIIVTKPYQIKSYHGTGDIFSSVIVGNILNNQDITKTLIAACEFIIKSINATIDDENHDYAVKFEDVLAKR